MDQDSTGGSDKRNWRERLGIGTKDSALIGKDMPKVSEEFKTTSTTAQPKAVASNVRPAPMAPRPAAAKPVAAPGSARPAAQPAPRAQAMAPDALANKLKSQRDAAEKLAEQRVAAAKQRAETTKPAATNGSAEKPKFTFADEEPKPAVPRPAAPTTQPVQNVAPPPAPQQSYANQIAPPRPPLGGGQAVPSRVAPVPQPYPPQAYPQGQTYPQGQPYYPPQQPQYPQGYPPPPQGYAPVPPPGYRPIDPATGYTPPQPFSPQPRPPFVPAGGGAGPRLQVPQRPPVTGFNTPQVGFGANQRLTNPPPVRQVPSAGYAEGEEDDIFEQPAPRVQRRATAEDYSQAYREVETGLDEEQQRSGRPFMLLILLGLLVASALLAVWGYTNYIKNGGQLTSGNNVPVVAAPEKPAKTSPDATATDNAAAGKAVNTSKKLIYDRIVGDQEVPSGKLVPSEEQPVQPANNSAPMAPPAGDATPPPAATGTGNDGTPLPLPPPPGGTTGTQGTLEPTGKTDPEKTDQAMISPAASESSAAVPIPAGNEGAAKPVPAIGAGAAIVPAGSDAIAQAAEAPKPAQEVVADNTLPAEPLLKEKKAAVKTGEAKKSTSLDPGSKSLGAKPVVLIPPSKLAVQNTTLPIATKSLVGQSNTGGGGLYGNTEIGGDNATAAVVAEAPPVEPPKKRRTLLDLFRTDSRSSSVGATAPSPRPAPPTQQVATADPQSATPAPSDATGAYVAQLASFKSKAEANAEYSRLVIKHGAIIKRYAPIIEQASVAGSTRYRLNIGPMASTDVASSFCSSLFAAGERDCLVHRQ